MSVGAQLSKDMRFRCSLYMQAQPFCAAIPKCRDSLFGNDSSIYEASTAFLSDIQGDLDKPIGFSLIKA